MQSTTTSIAVQRHQRSFVLTACGSPIHCTDFVIICSNWYVNFPHDMHIKNSVDVLGNYKKEATELKISNSIEFHFEFEHL